MHWIIKPRDARAGMTPSATFPLVSLRHPLTSSPHWRHHSPVYNFEFWKFHVTNQIRVQLHPYFWLDNKPIRWEPIPAESIHSRSNGNLSIVIPWFLKAYRAATNAPILVPVTISLLNPQFVNMPAASHLSGSQYPPHRPKPDQLFYLKSHFAILFIQDVIFVDVRRM
jgi:hypothetical protein